MVKEFLSHHNVEYNVFNVAEDDKAREEMMTKHDSMSTPTIIVDEEVIVGFDQERLTSLLNLS
jgi:glutaredoxin 3